MIKGLDMNTLSLFHYGWFLNWRITVILFHGIILAETFAFAFGEDSTNPQKNVKNMKTILRRVFPSTKGDVALELMISDEIKLTGKQKDAGCIIELHRTLENDKTKDEYVIWRVFRLSTFPVPRGKWYSDIILDSETNKVYLGLGRHDRFELYIIQMNDKPMISFPINQPLSPVESDELLQSLLKEKRAMIPPPDIWKEIKQTYPFDGVSALNLKKHGDIIQFFIKQTADRPIVILRYSLSNNKWILDKTKDAKEK
jgi:hypothetical protein